MDTKKFDYTDLIDMDCKNQTAKLLENYFHRMRGEYDSIVAVEEETYSEQPFFEFAEHINEKENQEHNQCNPECIVYSKCLAIVENI